MTEGSEEDKAKLISDAYNVYSEVLFTNKAIDIIEVNL